MIVPLPPLFNAAGRWSRFFFITTSILFFHHSKGCRCKDQKIFLFLYSIFFDLDHHLDIQLIVSLFVNFFFLKVKRFQRLFSYQYESLCGRDSHKSWHFIVFPLQPLPAINLLAVIRTLKKRVSSSLYSWLTRPNFHTVVKCKQKIQQS